MDSNTASVLVRDAPTSDYVVETKVRLSGLPDEGCCFNYAQAGLVLYGDDDNFVKLTERLHLGDTADGVRQGAQSGARWVEPLRQHGRRPARRRLDLPANRRGAPDSDEQREAGGDTERYTAYTSQDGVTWVRGGVWTPASVTSRSA